MKPHLSNFTASILGGAIGDALGAPVEFMDLKTILTIYGKNGVMDYVEFNDGHGEITDDTQMLLFTAEGLLRYWHRASRRGIGGSYHKIAWQSYQRWLYTQEGDGVSGNECDGWLIQQSFLFRRRAPGLTCLAALRNGNPGTMNDPVNNSKGCGGIMRIAPVGLLFNTAPAIAFRMGAELAAMTHGHPSGYLSAGYLAALLAYLCSGEELTGAMASTEDILVTFPGHEETLSAVRRAISLWREGQPSFQKLEELGGGWVGEEALSISLYCALSYPNNFERALNLAVNHSGDTDSTGSITGNIMGLLLGEAGIPPRWIDNLAHAEIIKEIASDLLIAAQESQSEGFGEHWERKYPPW
jgi:ADP-ribosylglycohydrolase